jgi:hypothetical protein
MGFKKTIFAKKPVGRYNDSDGRVSPSFEWRRKNEE